MSQRTTRRVVAGVLTAAAAAAMAAGAGLGQSQPAHRSFGQALRGQTVREAAVERPIPAGGEGDSGVAPPSISTAPNGDEVINYTDANGNSYSFQVSAKEISNNPGEVNVWEKLQQGLGRAGQFSNGDNGGTGYEYVPVLRSSGPTPDLLRLEWDNGQLVSATRVDIYSPTATKDVDGIYDVINNEKQGVQADEVVIDLEGRDQPSIMNVVSNIGDSMRSDNTVDFQKLDGVRIVSDAQTYAPPTVDVTVVRAAGATTDPVPLGLGGVTVTGDAAVDNAQAAVVDAAAAQLPAEELPAYEVPED